MRCLVILVTTLVSFQAMCQQSLQQKKEMVRGGAFKDLILPAPIINGLESEGIWGGPNVIPRDKDNGIEDNEWCYWGGNPIKDSDGKYHIAVCRWPEKAGHNGWYESEVAHCVSDNPIGPYKLTQTIVEKGHNPEVLKMKDGTYALHVLNNNSVYTANKMGGPWEFLGNMTLNVRGLRSNQRMGSNLTTEFRPDGSILLMTKGGDIAISNSGILGPYNLVSIKNYTRNSGYAEDPVIWRSRYQYHCIYNHAQDRKSGYMRSLDGIHWKNEEGLPYDVSSTYYEDGSKNEWYKFERAKVVQDELGGATHLSLAVIDIKKGNDRGNDNHSSKNMILPLVKEKLITILNKKPITSGTKKIILKIEAEDGFNPQTDLDISSLRFGSDSKVNYGLGCKVKKYKCVGKDLILHFEGEHGLTRFDYDFKLIGETTKGDLVIGYALLPQNSTMAASLVALPPKVKQVDDEVTLECIIENDGLSTSKSTVVVLMEHSKEGWKELKRFQTKQLEPYESTVLSAVIDNPDWKNCEYELEIEQPTYDGFWHMVDDSDSAVEYSGDWTLRSANHPQYYMGDEHVTETVGNTVKFTFYGCKARAYGTLDNKLGSFDVYIDGEFVENIRLSWGGPFSKIYQTKLLPEGLHTLELKSADFSGNVGATIDAFSFESPANKTLLKNSKNPKCVGFN